MDSQQAAFEKFKTSGSGHGSGRGRRSSEGNSLSNRRGDDGPMPDLYSIHHGKVMRVEDFGAFVQLPGFRRHGLVHKTQASKHFTEKISDVVAVGDQVWVKVTSLQDDKIALSMKYVSQGNGQDLDPNLVQLTGAEDKRRTHAGFMDKAPISIEQGGVLLKTVCRKCGASGHLATECFSAGEKFELLEEDDYGDYDGGGVQEREKEKKKRPNKDRHNREEGKSSRDRDRDREHDRHHRESSGRRDHKDKKESSSSRRKDKRHDRSRRDSAGPDTEETAMTTARRMNGRAVLRGQDDLSVDGGLSLGLALDLGPDHVPGRGHLVEGDQGVNLPD
ncbi:Nucleolar protein of 40 kDa [Mortierella sp. AD031]|nr:Nucleolar protein of 40 kDa [Mortierella sp. AD031]KAG0200751.1 Nucleolar protein of 40 kDa [Mortierella sp. NVP41]